MNTTREVVAPAMRAAAEDMCGESAERLFTSDTRDLMAFFVILKKLLREVCFQMGFAVARSHPSQCNLTTCSAAFSTSRSPTSISLHITDSLRSFRT